MQAPGTGRAMRGFTLIELLVVVSIIALLVSILMPSLSSAREGAKTVKCAANAKQIGLAMQYVVDVHGVYPFQDDSIAAASKPGHKNLAFAGGWVVLGTWLDVLFTTRNLPDLDVAYCPKDRRPDPMAESRGMDSAWQFAMPKAAKAGCDVSYGISAAMESNGYFGAQSPGYTPIDQPTSGSPYYTQIAARKYTSNRVLFADGFWHFIHGFSAAGIPYNRFNIAHWGSNTLGWRHGTKARPAANLAFVDNHVETVHLDLNDKYANGLVRGVRTTNRFFWRPNEHTEICPGDPANPPVFNVLNIEGQAVFGDVRTYPFADPRNGTTRLLWPVELDPDWYTRTEKWHPSLYPRKGWRK